MMLYNKQETDEITSALLEVASNNCNFLSVDFMEKKVKLFRDIIVRRFQSLDVPHFEVVRAIKIAFAKYEDPKLKDIEAAIWASKEGNKPDRDKKRCFVCDDSGYAYLIEKKSGSLVRAVCVCPDGEGKKGPAVPDTWKDYWWDENVLLTTLIRDDKYCLKDSREHFGILGLNYDDYLPPHGREYLKHVGHIKGFEGVD